MTNDTVHPSHHACEEQVSLLKPNPLKDNTQTQISEKALLILLQLPIVHKLCFNSKLEGFLKTPLARDRIYSIHMIVDASFHRLNSITPTCFSQTST